MLSSIVVLPPSWYWALEDTFESSMQLLPQARTAMYEGKLNRTTFDAARRAANMRCGPQQARPTNNDQRAAFISTPITREKLGKKTTKLLTTLPRRAEAPHCVHSISTPFPKHPD